MAAPAILWLSPPKKRRAKAKSLQFLTWIY
jgi:hypothetical protein